MYPRTFIAGFAATLVFHQGVLWLMYQAGTVARAPWNMAPVPPFGVPAVVSLAFWGGLWGGAFFAGGDPRILVGALLLNGAWGLGVMLLMKLMPAR